MLDFGISDQMLKIFGKVDQPNTMGLVVISRSLFKERTYSD